MLNYRYKIQLCGLISSFVLIIFNKTSLAVLLMGCLFIPTSDMPSSVQSPHALRHIKEGMFTKGMMLAMTVFIL